MLEDLASAVLASVSSSQFGCWLGRPAPQNPHSLDPLRSCPCRGRWMLTATLQPCSGCTPGLIFSSWLAPTWQSWTVMVLWWQS